MKNSANKSGSNSILHNILNVVGIVMCIILVPILLVNCTLIIQGFTSDKVPSLGGRVPLIVLTNSMYPEIEAGDLIITEHAKPEEVQVGDVIAFVDPAGNGVTVVTHRVAAITEEDGQLAWQTKGDNNTAEDRLLVTADNLVAVYRGTRFAGLGTVAMFMQSAPGLVVCVILPTALLLAYDMVRRKIYEKQNQEDTDALRRELEALRAQKAQVSQEAESL